MMSRAIVAWLLFAILPLVPAARAGEGDNPIRDGAKLFSPEAISRATHQILERRAIDGNLLRGRINARAQLAHHPTVNTDPATQDQLLAMPPRTDARGSRAAPSVNPA